MAGKAIREALTLLERLETKLERHPGQLTRAAVERSVQWEKCGCTEQIVSPVDW